MDNRAVEVIIGPMKSDKTMTLIKRLCHAQEYGNQKYIIFKPTVDTRSGKNRIFSYSNDLSLPAIDVHNKNPKQ